MTSMPRCLRDRVDGPWAWAGLPLGPWLVPSSSNSVANFVATVTSSRRSGDGASDEFLVLEGAVGLRRVDEGDPEVDGAAEGGQGLLFVGGRRTRRSCPWRRVLPRRRSDHGNPMQESSCFCDVFSIKTDFSFYCGQVSPGLAELGEDPLAMGLQYGKAFEFAALLPEIPRRLGCRGSACRSGGA